MTAIGIRKAGYNPLAIEPLPRFSDDQSGSFSYITPRSSTHDTSDGAISVPIWLRDETTRDFPHSSEREDISISYRVERLDSNEDASEDFYEAAGTITIKKYDNPVKFIRLNLKPDGKHEGPEKFRITLENPVNATLGIDPRLLQQVDFEIPREYGHSATFALADKDRQPDRITLVEGEDLELQVYSNAKDEFWADKRTVLMYKIRANGGVDDAQYAGADDISIKPPYKWERIETSIKDGTPIKLNAPITAITDGKKEVDQWFEIDYFQANGEEFLAGAYGTTAARVTIIDSSKRDKASPGSNTGSNTTQQRIEAPSAYGTRPADIITNYNPKSDNPIQIELDGFSGAAGTLKIARRSKQVAKLAKKDLDFIYDRQAGYLYYNENGKEAGFGDGGIFAILEGKPKAGLGNFDFV